MISRMAFCSLQPAVMRPRRLADAVDLEQTLWRALDDVEDSLAEGGDQPTGKMRPNALDHTRAKVALDALDGGGGHHLQKAGAELQPVVAMLLPLPARLDALAGMDLGRRPQHRHEVLVAAHLDAQHAKAGLGTMERDAHAATRPVVWSATSPAKGSRPCSSDAALGIVPARLMPGLFEKPVDRAAGHSQLPGNSRGPQAIA
jgi:hypothetical protein